MNDEQIPSADETIAFRMEDKARRKKVSMAEKVAEREGRNGPEMARFVE